VSLWDDEFSLCDSATGSDTYSHLLEGCLPHGCFDFGELGQFCAECDEMHGRKEGDDIF